MNRKIVISIVLLLALLATLCCGAYLINHPTGLLSNVTLGVISSLSASLIYSICVYFIINEPINDRLKLKEMLVELEKRELRGIKTIRDKYTHDPKFWISFLNDSDRQFDCMGNALTTWCEEPYKKSFASQLIKIAKNGGTVRILILKENGESSLRRQYVMGKNYGPRIIKTLHFIKTEVIDLLDERSSRNILLKQESRIDLPYMFLRNQNRVLVSPYLARTDSNKNLLLSFTPESPFSNIYINDFEEVFGKAVLINWKS